MYGPRNSSSLRLPVTTRCVQVPTQKGYQFMHKGQARLKIGSHEHKEQTWKDLSATPSPILNTTLTAASGSTVTSTRPQQHVLLSFSLFAMLIAS
jgi:hypothetical protein